MTIQIDYGAFADPATFPPRLAAIIERLAEELDAHASVWAMSSPREDESGSFVEPDVISVVGNAESALRISREMRSLLTAFAHRFASPRPSIAALAAAQSADVTAMRARYNASHVRAIEQLLTDRPDLDVVCAAVRCLSREQIMDALGMLVPAAPVRIYKPELRILVRARVTRPGDQIVSPELTAHEAERLEQVSRHALGYTLLGVVSELLGPLSFYTRQFDAWLTGSTVWVEWASGPTIERVVSESLLPSQIDPESGVPGLRLLKQDSMTALLEWLHPEGTIDLRLVRGPKRERSA